MAVFTEPTQWGHPLGNNADTVTIPDDTGASTGLASLQKLFQQINQLPLSAGGIAPSRTDFNALFKLVGDSIFYAMTGGIASYNAAYDYPVGALVKYNNVLYEAIQANGPDSTVATPTDSTYWSQIPTYADLSDLMPTGVVLPFGGSTVPNGWLLANGAAASRSGKARLFSVYGTTFGAGDGSTTFNLPDLRDRYIIGVNTNALGTQIAEQLPNIKGMFTLQYGAVPGLTHTSGAIININSDVATLGLSGGGSQKGVQVNFNAHNSNSVYTDSGKVYPLSLALNFIIKV